MWIRERVRWSKSRRRGSLLKSPQKQSKETRRLKSRSLKVASFLGITTAIASVISIVIPIEWIKVADCSLGFQCQLFRQETLIASIYGWNPNVLYRENFGLMLVVYGIAVFSYLKFMFEGVSLIKK